MPDFEHQVFEDGRVSTLGELRIDRGEGVLQQGADAARDLGLVQCALPFDPGLHACRFRLCVQHGQEHQGHEQSQGGCRRQGDGDGVARDELADAVAGRIGARQDRQAFEVVAQVLCQGLGRGVAPVRLGVQRLEQDRVEIPVQGAAQARRYGGAACGDLFGGGRGLRSRLTLQAVGRDGLAGTLARSVTDDALDLRRRLAGERVGTHTGEQLVQHDPRE